MPLKMHVSQPFLRAFCDEQGIWEALRGPQSHRILFHQGAGKPAHLPAGSLSQLWEMKLPTSELVVRAHFYRGPEGDMLGRPDPKYIRWGPFTFFPGKDP